MGKANQLGTGEAIVGGRPFAGLAVDVGNPHLACVDADLTAEELAALDVAAPVAFDAAQFPEGVNVEVLTAPRRRVRCRCGYTSAVSAKRGPAAPEPSRPPSPRWHHAGAATGALKVRIPGGEVTVTVTDATSYLRGPSVLVARGELSEEWWRAQQR